MELAEVYLPDLHPRSAHRKLQHWITIYPGLPGRLLSLGYHEGERVYSPPWCGPSSSRSASRESRMVSGWNRVAKSMERKTDSIDLADRISLVSEPCLNKKRMEIVYPSKIQ